MENIHGKRQPQWMLLSATTGLAVSVSLCFAQGNREAQLLTAPPETAMPFPCDSLDPKVCFDIYQRRMERIPAPLLSDDQGTMASGASWHRPGLGKESHSLRDRPPRARLNRLVIIPSNLVLHSKMSAGPA
jgi:hypothetical protein